MFDYLILFQHIFNIIPAYREYYYGAWYYSIEELHISIYQSLVGAKPLSEPVLDYHKIFQIVA